MTVGPDRFSPEFDKATSLHFMAADFVAGVPLLNELPLEPRIEAVDKVFVLILDVDEVLKGKIEGASHVGYIGRSFRDGQQKAIVDRGRVVDGTVEHDVNLWKIGHLKHYLASRRERGLD